MTTVAVIRLTESHRDQYETFLCGRSRARFGHTLAWADALRRTYGFRLEHLLALEDDRVVGVMPLFLSRSLVLGRHLVTSPFPSYAGPVYDSTEALAAMLEALDERRASVAYVSLYTGEPLPTDLVGPRLRPEVQESTFLCPLSNDPDRQFESLPKNIRRDVRFSARHGVEIEVDAEGRLQEEFYRLYASTYSRKHGLPPHPRSLFRNLWRELGGESLRVYLAWHQKRPVAAVMTLRCGGEIYYAWSATDDSRKTLQPTTALLWRIIADGCKEGFEVFNMGEAPVGHAGLVRFKKRWCPEVRGAYSYFLPGTSRSAPRHYYDDFGWQKKLIAALPLPVTTRVLSPLLRFVL